MWGNKNDQVESAPKSAFFSDEKYEQALWNWTKQIKKHRQLKGLAQDKSQPLLKPQTPWKKEKNNAQVFVESAFPRQEI